MGKKLEKKIIERKLNKDIQRAKDFEYASIIGLKANNITKLVNKGLNFSNITEGTLDELVKEKLITNAQKENLLLTSRIGLITGENFDLIKAIKTDNVKSLTDFLGWEKSDWLTVIKEKKIPLPADEDSPETYADNICKTIEKTFPTHYFLYRTINNAPVNDYNKLIQQVNIYRHLGIGEIIDRQTTHQKKQEEISIRLTALNTFYANNPEINFELSDFSADLNYKKENGLNWKGVEENLRPLVQRQMAAYQRAYIMGETYDTSEKLLRGGYDSASIITSLSEEDFIKGSGLGIEKGRRVYERAINLAIGASHYFEAIRDGVRGKFKDITVANQHPLVNDLKEIDGFDTLFGSQDYCDCEHCCSILSPAAYFTDLMYFVQENVSKKVFIGDNADHPISLKRRRPDLWKLKLNCFNTTNEIPYLEVVNEVLENYLETELTTSDVYQYLNKADWSINQPFNLPLEELRLYLSHFGINLYDVYKDMHIDTKLLHCEKLKLSAEELNIIVTKNTAGTLKRFGNKPLNNFDVQEFIGFAGIKRGELDDLLKSSFLSEIALVKVKQIKDNSDIQKYTEVLENLTPERLDFIHRYLRLWKKTSWNLKEFDLLLLALKSEGLLTNLEESNGIYPKVLQLAQLINIQDNLKLTVEELASVINELSLKPLIENEKCLAERLFDIDKINDALIPYKTPFLLAGLGVTEAELLDLAKLVSADLSQPISLFVLSGLYRQARIAKAVKMNIEDYCNMLLLEFNGQPIKTLNDLERLIEFSGWLKKSPLTISELVFILKGMETSSVKYKTDLDTVSAKILEIEKLETFKDKKLIEDYLQARFNLTNKQFTDEFLPYLLTGNFNEAASKALNATFTNEIPDNPTVFNDLLDLIRQLERYMLLFTKYQFKPDSISYLISHCNTFGISNLKALTVDNIKLTSLYCELIMENENLEVKLQKALTDFQSNANFTGSESFLSEIWKQPAALIQSLSGSLPLGIPALSAIKDLWAAVRICQKLGIQSDSLTILTGNDYKSASEVALGAFTSKYDTEKTRNEKLEPYRDKINSLRRDALCDYILSRYDKFKFKDRNDLYAFFLLSVEMSGSFRTSKLVAAITSLQLYIHRCLINLEVSDKTLNPSITNIEVIPSFIPSDEWEWRKNYRVWEANRKVFLYPENYIDPSLRGSKTHLFKELEDELLQQEITKDSAETAYKKYLCQFTELTRLRYAGAYYNQVYDNNGYVKLDRDAGEYSSGSAFYMVNALYFPSESDDSCFYLFARTNIQPYQYYYRTYNDNRKTWGNWIKIEMSIEASEISPLIHQGKLYIFWTEVKSKEKNNIEGGDSTSAGYVFKAYVKYSFMNENGKWNVPQRLYIGQADATEQLIYGRARNTNTFDPNRWKNEKDDIIEAYEKKVFRKPYSFRNLIDSKAPIGLSYIWTNNKSNTIVTYNSTSQSYSHNFYGFNIEFDIPPQSFTITNNDFSSATKKVNITVVYRFLSNVIFNEETVEGTIQLINGTCMYYVVFWGFPFVGLINCQVETQNMNATQSNFYLSLASNQITNPAEVNIFNSQSIHSLEKEFIYGYADSSDSTKNGNYATYMENGSKQLTSYGLLQTDEGNAGVQLWNGDKCDYLPLNTILTDEISTVLYAQGLEQFLSLKTQEMTDDGGLQFDFRGPYGEYYWEMFFHIPFLIANHFNANQKFKEAKWWYERIFNPNVNEKSSNTETADHYWQFREFRGLTPQKLKDILSNTKAIEAYKKDPFDPHAIAQLRISSYQKSIVMKYIDNLLDWGDYLFAQDTRESINEAEMLYRLASDILGKRPVKVGKCETVDENMLTYEKVCTKMGTGNEFLITLENRYWTQKKAYEAEVGFIRNSKNLRALFKKSDYDINFKELGKMVSVQRASDLVKIMNASARTSPESPLTHTLKNRTVVASYVSVKSANTTRNAIYERWLKAENTIVKRPDIDSLHFKPKKRFPTFDLVKQSNLVFCVPENKDLIQYWDRLDDRLFKIWNCMNIKGIRRSLSLFQPPIDPMLLVRLRASGLSLEEAIALTIINKIPNYRFSFLIERAKQFTQTVQEFGSKLLNSLEKKDGEELALLCTVHEKNILRMTKNIKKKQIEEAKAQYKSTEEFLKNVENRIEYYNSLIETGLIPHEITEQASKYIASGIRITEATLGFMAGVFGFLPQLGSPFAMKYGGQELKNGTECLANATSTLAVIADQIAILAGLEASHQRREEEWTLQLKLSEQEYKQVNQQLIAAEIRQQIAEFNLELHEKDIEQIDELHDFYKNKFTNLGLYNYMASSLNRLYRTAYNMAYDMAKLAEKAYQFERFDDSIFIQNDNWQFDKAGLLAAERLMVQLQELEKKHLENNVRTPEMTQTFSLAMLDASQLLELRQKGSCVIRIPEIAFEILYPGQYRRIIKSVCITIPCLAGAYTNVSAKLTLLKGMIEKNDGDTLEELEIAKLNSITTSSANNDSCMFDLNFNDERYLPFEGAGAVNSEWKLELPSKVRSFNYDTISDVLLHISYTALDGDRDTAENLLSDLLQNFAANNGLFRLFSLRNEFPDSFNMLFNSANPTAEWLVNKTHFSYLLADKNLSIEQTLVYLKPHKDCSISVPSNMSVNGTNVSWSDGYDIAFGDISDEKNKIKGGKVDLSGNPDKKWTINAGINELDKETLEDILLLVRYKV